MNKWLWRIALAASLLALTPYVLLGIGLLRLWLAWEFYKLPVPFCWTDCGRK